MLSMILALSLFLSPGALSSVASGGDFDRMKALVGQWEAMGTEGKVQITFQLISNGTALMETMAAGSHHMVTVYHPDGDAVLMTHYCSAGNQPRLRAREFPGGNTITFQFVDVANLKASNEGHMRRLVIRFQDADHVTEEWTWGEKGKESTSLFSLKRAG